MTSRSLAISGVLLAVALLVSTVATFAALLGSESALRLWVSVAPIPGGALVGYWFGRFGVWVVNELDDWLTIRRIRKDFGRVDRVKDDW